MSSSNESVMVELSPNEPGEHPNVCHVPSRFSPEDSDANRIFLQQKLDVNFFIAERHKKSKHELLECWNKRDPGSDLEVNWLAEDLRLVIDKPRVEVVLRDLLDSNSYLSARHTLHVAALFERSRKDTVTKFVDSGNSVAPDFIIKLRGEELPVEAKALMESYVEKSFYKFARELSEAAVDFLKDREEDLGIFVLVPDALNPPTSVDLGNYLDDVRVRTGIFTKFPNCTIEIQKLPQSPGVKAQRIVYVMSPLHEKDYLRIRGPAGQASKQLQTSLTSLRSGILALGLRHHQQSIVVSILRRHIRQGYLSGIAAVVFNKRRSAVFDSRLSTLDLLDVSHNTNATSPLKFPIFLNPLHFGAKLSVAEPWDTDQPVYRFGISQAKVADASQQPRLFLPDIRRIENGYLA